MGKTFALTLRTLAFALGLVSLLAGATEIVAWSVALPASLPWFFVADIIGRRLRAHAARDRAATLSAPADVPYRFIVPRRQRDDIDRAA